MLTKDQIHSYNQVRLTQARNLICHAPSVSLNFEQNGNVSACCYNRSFSLGKIPDQSISSIWKGEKAEALRRYIQNNDLSGGCTACQEVIQSGNYQGTKAIYYDEFAEKKSIKSRFLEFLGQKDEQLMPKLFEFELSNSCNLECVMCNGYFSSAIRKNREHLPPIRNHYGDGFVEQLIPFLPTLTDAKFLGGEPFLIDIYYKIWEKIIEVNPSIKVHITTNGTVLNKKTKSILEKLNAGIIISIDSINKSNYENIRVNAQLEDVLKNIEYFLEYTRSKKTYLSIAVCPIIENRYDIPQLLEFCNESDIHIHFNTVWNPEKVSLRFLNANELKKTIDFYQKSTFLSHNKIQRDNVHKFQDFIAQLQKWMEEKTSVEEYADQIKNWQETISKWNSEDLKMDSILWITQQYYLGNMDHDQHLNQLRNVYMKMGELPFIIEYFDSMSGVVQKFTSADVSESFRKKIEIIIDIAQQSTQLQDVIEEIIRAGYVFQIHFIIKTDFEELTSLTYNRFLKN